MRRFLAAGGMLAFATAAGAAQIPAAVNRAVDFEKDVRPILAAKCYSCHGPEKQKSSYRLDDRGVALRGGELGRAIVVGDGAGSPLIQYAAGVHQDVRMPPKGEMLSSDQVGVLRAWIDQGAKWTEVKAEAKPVHWSLRSLSRPAVPVVNKREWVRNSIDAFVLTRLEEKGLAPSAEADRRTLIRRVTFDLTGLPPTPEEVEAFVSDGASDAFEKAVDRLLASPRYGERWARHWMDAVHYAETHGHDEDKPRPNAWPYRDYLIRSFNEDKAYARFVTEQVAGDVLYPADPQGLVATALLAVGPWDQSSQMGIQDGTLDKQAARYLDRDDMIATVMSTFSSATVHCARCHDHKFDPISQEDYYALQAVFAGVDRVERAYDQDAGVFARRKELLALKGRLDSGTYPPEGLLDGTVQRRVEKWEREQAEAERAWKVATIGQVKSAQGSELAVQCDGSILASGKTPDKDTYTIVAETELLGVTGLRLEVMTDQSLPMKGPGRRENGNFHLSEVSVIAAPKGKPAATRPVAIKSAAADFEQQDYGVAKAIDGKRETSWAVHPMEGRGHVAVFALAQPVSHEGGSVLTVTLEQVHGGGHLIGRLRLSVTTAPLPGVGTVVPEEIAKIMELPASARDEKRRAALARHVLKVETERELENLGPPKMVYAVATDFEPKGNFKPARGPRAVEVLRRGDVRQPAGAARPGALSCVKGVDARFKLRDEKDEGERRAALARWLVDRQNVLTWRSIVNRVWHYHFGRGIVDTPNDLGKMGGIPSHPELLDWLAVAFRDEMAGSFKKLHRLMVTSAAYRQSSSHGERASHVDAGNRLLWRMNRTRLDAEQVRDAILMASGKMDLATGGPSVKQFVETKGLHETPNVDYAALDVDDPANFRRAVYRFVFRTIPDPFMRSLDCPDASQLSPTRESSVTAIQALAMLNNAFVVRQSEHLAKRLEGASTDRAAQVERLFEATVSRKPTHAEREAVVRYAQKHGLANACRMILNSNEFMFVN